LYSKEIISKYLPILGNWGFIAILFNVMAKLVLNVIAM